MAVRLFVGNLPYSATEADLREYFSSVAPPSSIAVPVDRDTGRPRGFAFIEYADSEKAQEAIERFNGVPFQGRPLSVSEARAREDRGPRPGGPAGPRPGGFGGPRPGGGFGGPRPGGGFGGPRPGGGFGRPMDPGSVPPGLPRDRGGSGHGNRNFGPDAKPKRAAKYQQRQDKPRGPIREKNTGRVYSVDAFGEEESGEEFSKFDKLASSLPEDDNNEGGEE
ncbi:MAG: RNA recognition motif domain-containing protein [Acidobacteriota bacterium]